MSALTLYTYYRSTAAYRVRIALNLKKVDYSPHFVHLTRRGGQQHSEEYHDINPQELVPTLIDGGTTVIQSLAILEYLEERYPAPPLLPDTAAARAWVRSVAQLICCDIHPLNNLRVLNYLRNELKQNSEICDQWYHHWIAEGLSALELLLNKNGKHDSDFCYGDTPTIADLCVIPQLYNARRFNCDTRDYPTLLKIDQHCMTLDAFRRAAPENQPDHE